MAKHSAAEMLAAAKTLYDELDKGPDFPGKERFLHDCRRRVELLERRAKEENNG